VAVSRTPGEELLEAADETVEAVTPIVQALSDPLVEKPGGCVVGEVENPPKTIERTVVEVFENSTNIDDIEAGTRAELERGREASVGGWVGSHGLDSMI
jgi:hypothetical protein